MNRDGWALAPLWLWEREIAMRVGDNMRAAVAFIGYTDRRNQFVPYGTGFCALWKAKTYGYPLVVTARHVVEGARGVPGDVVTVRVSDETGFKVHKIPKDQFFFHPDHDPDRQYIDVAVATLPKARPTDELTWIQEEDFLTDDLISQHKIGIGDEIAVVGMLFAHFGETKHIPIVRIGNIAAMRDEPVPTDFGYMDAYLTEARSLGGISGSPALVHMRAREAIMQRRLGTFDYYLLGLVHGHYGVTWEGELVKVMSTLPVGEMNSGIAIVVPASKILETINQPSQVALREQWATEMLSRKNARPD